MLFKNKKERQKELRDFGYSWNHMYPLFTEEEIREAEEEEMELYRLYSDDTEALIEDENYEMDDCYIAVEMDEEDYY